MSIPSTSAIRSDQIDAFDPASLKNAINSKNLTEEQKASLTAQQFETLFTSQFLKESLGKDYKSGYQSMAPQIFAQSLSSGQSIFGIASSLESELRN